MFNWMEEELKRMRKEEQELNKQDICIKKNKKGKKRRNWENNNDIWQGRKRYKG